MHTLATVQETVRFLRRGSDARRAQLAPPFYAPSVRRGTDTEVDSKCYEQPFSSVGLMAWAKEPKIRTNRRASQCAEE